MALVANWRQASEASMAAAEFAQCLAKREPIELRPHAFGENQFRIGAFPEQKIAQPPFASAADQQIDRLRIAHRFFKAFARKRPAAGPFASAHDGFAGRIINGQTQVKPDAWTRRCLGEFDRFTKPDWNTIAPPDYRQPYIVGQQTRRFIFEVPREQRHERTYLGGGPFPVIR